MNAHSINFWPGAALLALVAIAHLPLGLPASAGFVLPAIVMALIFIWSLTAPANVPAWYIFVLGLLADVLSSGPIGYWPLYYLSTQALAFWFGRNPVNSSMWLSWAGFLFTSLAVTFMSWSVATLYHARGADWQPMMWGALIVALLYPLIYRLSGAHRYGEVADSQSVV